MSLELALYWAPMLAASWTGSIPSEIALFRRRILEI